MEGSNATILSRSEGEALNNSILIFEDKPMRAPRKCTLAIQHSIAPFRNGRKVLARKVGEYHFGIKCCAATTATVLVINCVLTVWTSTRYGVHGGLGTIQEGACAQTKDLAT